MLSPTPSSHSSSGAPGTLPNVIQRPMRLKILYTFDSDSKTNCLARWPHLVDVKTVDLDQTIIGVVELKICIQAIVAASPELVAQLGQDYTVYAYDYSEYETPLVGQGMLSWALASASGNAATPAHQSRQLITGRVSTSILGILQNGTPQETLEVKLRLVPVPTCLQSEYLLSMEKYRDISRVVPVGFDPAAWRDFLQSNPDFESIISKLDSPVSDNSLELKESVAAESLDLFSKSSQQHEAMGMQQIYRSGSRSESASLEHALSHGVTNYTSAGNPVLSIAAGVELRQITQGLQSRASSRPSSRASNGSRKKTNRNRTPIHEQEMDACSEAEVETSAEDGPARKRARVTRIDWDGKSNMPNPESLRVAASTAASVRIHRPIARSPAISQRSLEEPPRVPTPRPESATEEKLRTGTKRRSALRCESSLASESLGLEANLQHHLEISVETDKASPDYESSHSCVETPLSIPSSPPMLPDHSPAPSSPALPATRDNEDSGFMSGPIDEPYRDDNEDAQSAAEGEQKQPTSSSRAKPRLSRSKRSSSSAPRNKQKSKLQQERQQSESEERPKSPSQSQSQSQEIEFLQVNPGPEELLPVKILPRPKYVKRVKPVAESQTAGLEACGKEAQANPQSNKNFPKQKPASRRPSVVRSHSQSPGLTEPSVSSSMTMTKRSQDYTVAAPKLQRTVSIGSLSLPPLPASDPVHQPSSFLQRSKSWAEGQHPMTDIPNSACGSDLPLPRSGSGAKRKKAIQSRLNSAIEAGEMPPYCDNCGAIETPTWRKAWAKYVQGSIGGLKISNEEGGILAIEIAQTDSDGQPIAFKLIKKNLLGSDENYSELTLCNSCGLWLSKMHSMRPEEKWSRQPKDPDKKKRYRPKKKPNSEARITSESEQLTNHPTVDQSTPSEQGDVETEAQDDEIEAPDDVEIIEVRPSNFRRAASAELPSTKSTISGGLDKATAEAALRRAIQSSPARLTGSLPISLKADKADQTCRLLFASPRKMGEIKVLDGYATFSLRSDEDQDHSDPDKMEVDSDSIPQQPCKEDQSKAIQDVQSSAVADSASDEKMPCTPQRNPGSKSKDRDDRIDQFLATPYRPSSAGCQSSNRRSQKSSVSFSSLFSSGGKAGLFEIRTPPSRRSRVSPYKDQIRPSPFTASLQQMLVDATAADNSPTVRHFDLQLGSGDTPNRPFQMTGLDSDFFTTDGPMPSSPPILEHSAFTFDNTTVPAGDEMWAELYTMEGDAESLEEALC